MPYHLSLMNSLVRVRAEILVSEVVGLGNLDVIVVLVVVPPGWGESLASSLGEGNVCVGRSSVVCISISMNVLPTGGGRIFLSIIEAQRMAVESI
jgi:hypothetical protein